MGTTLALCINKEILWGDLTDLEKYREMLFECHYQDQGRSHEQLHGNKDELFCNECRPCQVDDGVSQ